MAAAKKQSKKDLEDKIAELEAKLTKLSTQLETKPAEPKPAETKPAETKPAETKPAEPKPAPKPAEKPKATLPKGFGEKPAEKAEVPKPKEEAKQLPATFNEALENAYYTAPMTDFHKYRATVTVITSYSIHYTKLYEAFFCNVENIFNVFI